MSNFPGKLGLAIVLASAVCLGGRTAHAQAAPLSFWTQGAPVGFGGGLGGANNYGSFSSFDGKNGQDGGSTYNFPKGFFVRSGSSDGALNLSGIGQGGAFGNFTTQSTQFGYNFYNSPVKIFGGFDALKYDTGVGGSSAFAAFDSNTSTTAGYKAYGGVEFQPAQNVSVSLDFGYTQTGNNTSAPILPGSTGYVPRR